MGLDRYHTKRPLHDPLAALVCIFQHREPREIVHIPPSPSLDEIVAVLHYYHFSRDALPLKCPALTDSLFDPIVQSTHLPLMEWVLTLQAPTYLLFLPCLSQPLSHVIVMNERLEHSLPPWPITFMRNKVQCR